MTYIHKPSAHQRSGTTMQKMKQRGGQKWFVSAREVLPGYPITEKFKCVEEIDAYLSGERVACLICGKEYVALAPHIKRIHNVDAEDYKVRYGIPQSYGLAGAPFLKRRADNGRSEQNLTMMASLYERVDYHARAGRKRKNPLAPIIKERMVARVNDPALDKRTYQDDNFAWHLEMVATIYDHRNIRPPPGVASWSAYKKRLAASPALKSLHKQASDARPRSAYVGSKRAKHTA